MADSINKANARKLQARKRRGSRDGAWGRPRPKRSGPRYVHRLAPGVTVTGGSLVIA